MHPPVREWVAECATRCLGAAIGAVRPDYSVLEVGSLNVNGRVRDLFPEADPYHGLDIVAGEDVDIVADARVWRPERTYDVVVSTEMLEHCPGWEAAMDNAYDALAEAGYMILTCATTGRGPHDAHGAPTIDTRVQYYRNVGIDRFAAWAEGRFSWCELRKTTGADLQFFAQR